MFDPDEAQIFTITREGKGLNTKYSVSVSPKKQAVPKAAYSKLTNLDEYVMQESDEQKRKALSAINSVAGILGNDRPTTTPTAARAAISHDVEDAPVRAKAAVKPGPALDEELDDLLGDLAD